VPADNPAHRRIIGAIARRRSRLRIRQASQYRLPEQSGECVPAILPVRASAGTSFAIAVSPSASPNIGGDPRTMELKLHAPLEIEPEGRIFRLTRRVRHRGLAPSSTSLPNYSKLNRCRAATHPAHSG
jgi:hypothetical protein